MPKKLTTIVSLLFLFAIVPAIASAQTRRAAPSAGTLKFLPASDSIMVIEARRLLTEAMPLVTGADAAKSAQVADGLEKFKTRTGIDPRVFEQVVLGMRYTYPSPDVTKIETVAIASGKFDAKALIAGGRAAGGDKYREEKYRGMTISVFSLNEQIKLAGMWNVKLNELAVSAVDANTLAMGNVSAVRRAIDAGRAGTRSNAALMALARHDPNALIGFGMNVTRALLDSLHVGNDAVAKDVASIRQVYGSVGKAQADFLLSVVARTGTPAEAKGVSETATGFKQLGAIFVARMRPPQKQLAETGLNNLKITTQGNEVLINTRIGAADLASLVR